MRAPWLRREVVHSRSVASMEAASSGKAAVSIASCAIHQVGALPTCLTSCRWRLPCQRCSSGSLRSMSGWQQPAVAGDTCSPCMAVRQGRDAREGAGPHHQGCAIWGSCVEASCSLLQQLLRSTRVHGRIRGGQQQRGQQR